MKFMYTEACEISILFGALQQYPLCMTFAQAQEALGLGQTELYRKVHRKEVPAFRIGTGFRFLKPLMALYLYEMQAVGPEGLQKKPLCKLGTPETLQAYVQMIFYFLSGCPSVLSVEQTTEVLNVGEKLIYKLISSNELSALRYTQGYRILKTEIVKYLLLQSFDLSSLETEEK